MQGPKFLTAEQLLFITLIVKLAATAALATMLVRFRTQAVAAVTATLASSIETTIEELVSRMLADYVEKAPDAEG